MPTSACDPLKCSESRLRKIKFRLYSYIRCEMRTGENRPWRKERITRGILVSVVRTKKVRRSKYKVTNMAVLWIREIFVLVRIRICGYVALTYGSGSGFGFRFGFGSGSCSCSFPQWLSRRQQKIHFF